MPFTKEYPALPTVTTPPCIHLRNKAMYLRGTPGSSRNLPGRNQRALLLVQCHAALLRAGFRPRHARKVRARARVL